MRKISENLSKLQVKIQQQRGFTPVDNSIDDYGLGRAVKDTYRKLIRLIRMLGGECDWHMHRIAAYFHMHYETYRAHQRILKRVGLLRVVPRRMKGCRENLANLLSLVMGVVKINQRSEEKDLKTTTPAKAPASPPRREKSELQKLHEARFTQDRADSKWKREEYEAKASWWESTKAWMKRKLESEARRKADATVGYNPTLPPTAEQEAEYRALAEKIEANRMAKVRAEQEAKAERERAKQEAREAWIRRAYGVEG